MAKRLKIYRPKKLDSSVKVDRLKPGKVVKFNFKRSKRKPLKLKFRKVGST